jgi:glucose/arabinose dehydrogenase
VRRWAIGMTALALVLSGCGGDDPEDTALPTPTDTTTPGLATPTEDDPTDPGITETPTPVGTETASPTPSPTPTPSPSPSPTPPAGPPPLASVTVSWHPVGSGFQEPLQVLADPRDNAVLIVEQPGRIRTLSGATRLDIRNRVTSGGERGLLGVAFHPNGQRLFVHYTGADNQTVLSQFPVGSSGIADNETVLLTVPQPRANHNGGSLLFAPDGSLVLALGDGGGAGDPFDQGQDTTTLLGGLLRLDVDSAPGQARPHPDNPFLDGPAPELWVYGLRNPWRIAFDSQWLYIADVGQNEVEEVSVVRWASAAGANFGWPILEGSRCYREPNCNPSGTVLPVVEHAHDQGVCSIIGGVVVPTGHPTGLGGAYVYSDLCDARLWGLRMGASPDASLITGGALAGRPLGFGTGPAGQVYVATDRGEVLELRRG